MRAVVVDRYGPPEVARVADVEPPVPGDGDLLVRVRATTVNRTDCGYRGATPFIIRFFSGLRRPRRPILGTEFAGVIVETGAGTAGWDVGERIFGYVEGPFGAHAEHLRVRATGSIARIPDGIGFEEAAPATEAAHYALCFLDSAGVRSGQRVLVNGASGGIGSATVQFLRDRAVEVTAVCPTHTLDLVRQLGAERVIDHTADDFTEVVEPGSFDAVLDAVGKSTFGRCRHLLRPNGVYVSSDLGPLAQNPILALATRVLPGRSVRFPLPRHDQAMITGLADLMASGAFRPVIDRRYPLAEIAEAYRYVESGAKVGNVVITVDHPG